MTSLLVRIRALAPSRPPAERRVAQWILADPVATSALTITQLAEVAETSQTTVVRLCKALGLSGYPQLRLTLAASSDGTPVDVQIGSEIRPDDAIADVVAKVGHADTRAVEETVQALDVGVLAAVVDALSSARRIDIYGVGSSAFVALDLQQKLHRIGLVCFAWSDTHVALTSAAVLGEDDVAIGISHRGTTTEVIEALERARAHGATTVALTNFPQSPITASADHVLLTAARETTYRSGAMVSRIAQLTVVDCVFVGVTQRLLPHARDVLEATYLSVQGHHVDPRRWRRSSRTGGET